MKVSHLLTAVAAIAAMTIASIASASTLAERYAVAEDLSVFIQQRAVLPADGSFFYSYLARWECHDGGGIARRIAATGEVKEASGKRYELLRRQLKRCEHVSQDALGIAAQNMDRQAGAISGDKFFAALPWQENGQIKLASDEDFHRLLHFVAATDDQYMRVTALQYVKSYRLLLKGHRLDEGEARAFHAATQLAGCSLGEECGPVSRQLQGWCISYGECDDQSIEQFWARRAKTPPSYEMNWPLINEYRSELVRAVQRNDWADFKWMDAGNYYESHEPNPTFQRTATPPLN